MIAFEYYSWCARSVGRRQSPVTMTFVYYQSYLAKIEEEKSLPGFTLKRCKSVHRM
jgi:hypothetical protein